MDKIQTDSSTIVDKMFEATPKRTVGATPFFKADTLSQAYGVDIYFKDETKNPSGSFKDRAMNYQIAYWTQKGKTHFALSSTGNAGISAAMYALQYNVSLEIFISPNTTSYKIDRLQHAMSVVHSTGRVTLHISKHAKNELIQLCNKTQAVNLLASRDDRALIGYESLGAEIAESIDDMHLSIDGIFMPASSGSGLLGMHTGLINHTYSIPLYAIQTTKTNAIARAFTTDFIETKTSLASAISISFNPRKESVIKTIQNSKGTAFAISDEEILQAFNDVEKLEGTTLSYDSALSVAGVKKALSQGIHFKGVICILTGI